MQKVSMIGLPIYTLAEYRGMGMAVEALRRLGITEAVNQHTQDFKDLGDVKLTAIETDSGPSKLRNFPQFLRDTESILRAKSIQMISFSVWAENALSSREAWPHSELSSKANPACCGWMLTEISTLKRLQPRDSLAACAWRSHAVAAQS